MQPCEGRHEYAVQRGSESSQFPGLLGRTWAHGLWAPTPAPGQKRPTRTPGRPPWGWVRPGDAGCPVGVARRDSCLCPTSHHVPVRTLSVLQRPPSWLPLSLPQETLARLKPWPPSSWFPQAPGGQLVPHLLGVTRSPSSRGLVPQLGYGHSASGEDRVGLSQALFRSVYIGCNIYTRSRSFNCGSSGEHPLRFWLRSRGELRPLGAKESVNPLFSVVRGILHPVGGRRTLESLGSGLPCSVSPGRI